MTVIGRQIIEAVTSGQYDDPLMVLREYIQNAADSIDQATATGQLPEGGGRIDVTIDGRTRCVVIQDNGTGVSGREARRLLCGVGITSKNPERHRGFRGIGRLGGIGYCDEVVFESKAQGEKSAVVVKWDAAAVRDYVRHGGTVDSGEGLGKAVMLHPEGGTVDLPDRFFRVTLKNVHRFHRDALMDLSVVRDYLRQVAPVDYDSRAFPFGDEIRRELAGVEGFRSYSIGVNGMDLWRPHAKSFDLWGGEQGTIDAVQFYPVTDRNGQVLGKGWYAKTGCTASLPPSALMRGIRVRQGNIQIGDEYVLDDCFTERRFSTWHIGELHLNYRVKPNARRDGFEHSPEYESVIELCHRLGRHLSGLCREASRKRSSVARTEQRLQGLERQVRDPIIVDKEHRDRVVSEYMRQLREIELANQKNNGDGNALSARINSVKTGIAKLGRRRVFLSDLLDRKNLAERTPQSVLREVCHRLAALDRVPTNPSDLLEVVLSPYMSSGKVGT